MARAPKSEKQIDALKHDAATRRNIPTAEMESFFRRDEDSAPRPPQHYARARPLSEGETRTAGEPSQPELIWNGARITITDEQMAELAATGKLTLSDAQLVWRGKDKQDWSDLVVNVPPLYIQEKIHPKAIIDDLKRRTAQKREAETDSPDLFADFNGITPEQRAEFYQHDQHWSNRMILGDSLQIMASLAERESLKGKVQCIYFDPPYGVKFNSNWQVSTLSKDVKDGKQADISREPEQVKAFRDTWKDSIHSYLTYLRDRLTVMRDLLSDSGSIFVQISDENVHRVRAVMDEVFGESQFISQIVFLKTTGLESVFRVASAFDYILWFGKTPDIKYRKLSLGRSDASHDRFKTILLDDGQTEIHSEERERELREQNTGFKIVTDTDLTKPGPGAKYNFEYKGQTFRSGDRWWGTKHESLVRIGRANRFLITGRGKLRFARGRDDTTGQSATNLWDDIGGAVQSRTDPKIYVVQTGTAAIQRCILMATDPGDLVLDPTCGSGTSAYVAEQWGRRWITMDTSRVALALARTRLMAARYPWYLLADSREGRAKEAELTKRPPADTPVHNDIRQGFVYERVPHITLKSIANNRLIDDIWEKYQAVLEPLRATLNAAMAQTWEDWQIPRELSATAPAAARAAHEKWWEARIARQREIDASIAARADVEFLYDKPYKDESRVRVAGPFTVENLSPHRVLPASEYELLGDAPSAAQPGQDFSAIVIDYLKSEGVKQEKKNDRITFESLTPWPGNYIGAEGKFIEGENGPERRAAILIGPEYGTVGRQDIVMAAREAVDARFDVLIACAFNFDAHSTELGSLGSLKILKARINPDMHMSAELKNTGRGNMFVVFGEPDVEILDDGGAEIRVKVNGVDVFDPNTGDIRSNDTKGIAAWFIDTDYNEESFFVRHAYFLGANDPYKSLKTALQAEIDEDAWATLYADTSRPFPRPARGRIAVKVINHFGDEVMKIFGV
ncbi:MAG: site-specific DNA-methyltransferase [Acidocella sp.]|nr:site-specific DNA-methyltransferase [Acidocella sp.]